MGICQKTTKKTTVTAKNQNKTPQKTKTKHRKKQKLFG